MDIMDQMDATQEANYWKQLEEIDIANKRLQSHIEHDEEPERTVLQLHVIKDATTKLLKLLDETYPIK